MTEDYNPEDFAESVVELLKEGECLYLCPNCGLLDKVRRDILITEARTQIFDVFNAEIVDEWGDPYAVEEEVQCVRCPNCAQEVQVLDPLDRFDVNGKCDYEVVVSEIVEHVKKRRGEKEIAVLKRILAEEKIKSALSKELIKEIIATLI